MSNKDLAHHITNYRNVFIYLLIGTALTVTASYLEFNVKDSIAGAIFMVKLDGTGQCSPVLTTRRTTVLFSSLPARAPRRGCN